MPQSLDCDTFLSDCGAFCRENAARSPNCGAFGKIVLHLAKKVPQFCIPVLPAQIIKVWREFHKSAGRKSSAQLIKIVAFFLTHTIVEGQSDG